MIHKNNIILVWFIILPWLSFSGFLLLDSFIVFRGPWCPSAYMCCILSSWRLGVGFCFVQWSYALTLFLAMNIGFIIFFSITIWGSEQEKRLIYKMTDLLGSMVSCPYTLSFQIYGSFYLCYFSLILLLYHDTASVAFSYWAPSSSVGGQDASPPLQVVSSLLLVVVWGWFLYYFHFFLHLI